MMIENPREREDRRYPPFVSGTIAFLSVIIGLFYF